MQSFLQRQSGVTGQNSTFAVSPKQGNYGQMAVGSKILLINVRKYRRCPR